MIDIDKLEQQQLDKLMQMDKPDQFGCCFIQRNLFIGYNNACHVIELGIKNGVLEKTSNPYQYKVRV